MNGPTKFEGKVEYYTKDRWWNLCDKRWTLNHANAVCRQLGYGYALRATIGNAFGGRDHPLLKAAYICNHSVNFSDCEKKAISQSCKVDQIAGVVCLNSGALQI